jgi:hypothetical protein
MLSDLSNTVKKEAFASFFTVLTYNPGSRNSGPKIQSPNPATETLDSNPRKISPQNASHNHRFI